MNKQNILVTGASGFIGKYLCSELTAKGYNVIGIDKESGEISEQLFKFENIHHVFHLAALTYVVDSWECPKDFFHVNFMGTLNVLEYCRKNNISLTYFSSYVYGVPLKLPIDESHPIKAENPYGKSKIFADELCQFYNQNYNMNITIVRPFNIYGAYQSNSFLIPKIFNMVLDNKSKIIELHTLWPKRDLVYVEDVIDAVVLLFEKNSTGVFNIGSGYSLSIETILKTIFSVTGISKEYRAVNNERKNEIPETIADISKIKNLVGWHPKYDFKQGIEKMYHLIS